MKKLTFHGTKQYFLEALGTTKMYLLFTFVAILAVGGLTLSQTVGASGVTFDTTRDCNSNAVVYCGAMSISELLSKFGTQSGVAKIYAYYGLDKADIADMANSAVAGVVTKSGEVKVDGTVVATGAMTGGRDNIAGSTAVNINGLAFYIRPPSVSFLSNSLDAFVVMRNNNFAFAILASCGNVVVAKSVVKPTPTPKPTPSPTPSPTYTPSPTPTYTPSPKPYPSHSPHPKPSPTSTPSVSQTQTQSQTQTVVVNQTPEVVPTSNTSEETQSSTTPTPSPTVIPNTGSSTGSTVGIFLGASAVGTGAYQLFIRRRFFK